MARVGEEFPLECPACGGDIRLIAFITEPGPIRKILTHLTNRWSLHPSRRPGARPPTGLSEGRGEGEGGGGRRRGGWKGGGGGWREGREGGGEGGGGGGRGGRGRGGGRRERGECRAMTTGQSFKHRPTSCPRSIFTASERRRIEVLKPRERGTGTGSARTHENHSRRGARGISANRHRTPDTPDLAAHGQSVSRKTVAEVPLTGLSSDAGRAVALDVGPDVGLRVARHRRGPRSPTSPSVGDATREVRQPQPGQEV